MLLVPFLTFILGQGRFPPTGRQDGHCHLHGHHHVHLDFQRARAPQAWRGALGHRARCWRQASCWAALVASLGVFACSRAGAGVFFGLFVSFSAPCRCFWTASPPTRQMPGPRPTGDGRLIGFLSGLVGAGGGFVSVPFMTWCNVPIHNAVATSAALGFPIALANVVGYVISGQSCYGLPAASLGYIWLPALGVIATCSVLTAPLGAKAAHQPARQTAQTGVCQPAVRLGRLHALEGSMRSACPMLMTAPTMARSPSSSGKPTHEGLVDLELVDGQLLQIARLE
jgi:hypothetical protein